jgi:hypothetical protein
MTDELPDDDLLWEHWRHVGGGSSYAVTHLPSGIRIHDLSPSPEPVRERLATLRAALTDKVRAWGAGNDVNPTAKI